MLLNRIPSEEPGKVEIFLKECVKFKCKTCGVIFSAPTMSTISKKHQSLGLHLQLKHPEFTKFDFEENFELSCDIIHPTKEGTDTSIKNGISFHAVLALDSVV